MELCPVIAEHFCRVANLKGYLPPNGVTVKQILLYQHFHLDTGDNSTKTLTNAINFVKNSFICHEEHEFTQQTSQVQTRSDYYKN